MCGIAGVVGINTTKDILDSMLSTMNRRGPDGSGRYEYEDCALLHSRLAIIDPIGGKQPMELYWDNEWYIITYNGELYNTQELRQELKLLGHEFITTSDTEVLLHGYAQWGADCLQKLNGIYAFAVWHKRERKLFLARDRMGVKPLFYKLHNGGLVFASEIKTILSLPTVKAQLDHNGIAQILLLGPGRIPGSGVFRGIYELKPGNYAIYDDAVWSERSYWFLLDREHTETFEETAEHTRYLVKDAITRQMVSDVPIGTFLSGGLDSSLISAICADQFADSGQILNTFSVDYENHHMYFVPGKYQPTSDQTYIEIMQRYLSSNHHTTVLTPEDLIAHLQAATRARDLPGMADVDASLLAFCKEIRDSVKVALSGECADEIFGGYPWYRDPHVRQQEGFPWSQNIQFRSSFMHPEVKSKLDAQEFVYSLYYDTVNNSHILPGTDSLNKRMKQMVNLNHHWFMQTLLDRKDRMSMYCGLEVRVPFCDHTIAEYLYGVPWEFKDYQGKEKGLLRYAMHEFLPNEVIERKKSPYPKTHDPRYTAAVTSMLQDILTQNDAPIFSVVCKDTLSELANYDDSWPWYGQLMRTPQIMAYMLQINMWMQMYKIEVI